MDQAKRRATNRWTPEEHARLEELVCELGTEQWTEIAARMPGRTNKQVRQHWVNFQRPDAKQAGWSAEEEDIIAHMHAMHGPSWSVIARCLGNRTENSIKNHWHATFRSKASAARADSILCVYITLLQQGNKPNVDTYQVAKAQVAAVMAATAQGQLQQHTPQMRVPPCATSGCHTSTLLSSEGPACSHGSTQLQSSYAHMQHEYQQLFRSQSIPAGTCEAVAAPVITDQPSPMALNAASCSHPNSNSTLVSPPACHLSQQYTNNSPFSSGNLSTSSFQSLSHSASHASMMSLAQRSSGTGYSDAWEVAATQRHPSLEAHKEHIPVPAARAVSLGLSQNGSCVGMQEQGALSLDPNALTCWDSSRVEHAADHNPAWPSYGSRSSDPGITSRINNKRPFAELLHGDGNVDMTPGRFSIKRPQTYASGIGLNLPKQHFQEGLPLRRSATSMPGIAVDGWRTTPCASAPYNAAVAHGNATFMSQDAASGQMLSEMHPVLRTLAPAEAMCANASPAPAAAGSEDFTAWLLSAFDDEWRPCENNAGSSMLQQTAMPSTHTNHTPCTPPSFAPRVSLDAPNLVPGGSSNTSPAAALLRFNSESSSQLVKAAAACGSPGPVVLTPPGSMDLMQLLDSL